MLEYVRDTENIGRLRHTAFWLSNSELGVPSPPSHASEWLQQGPARTTAPRMICGIFKRAHAGENSRVYYYTALVNKAIVKERSCILNFSREALSLCETDRPRESCN